MVRSTLTVFTTFNSDYNEIFLSIKLQVLQQSYPPLLFSNSFIWDCNSPCLILRFCKNNCSFYRNTLLYISSGGYGLHSNRFRHTKCPLRLTVWHEMMSHSSGCPGHVPYGTCLLSVSADGCHVESNIIL